MSIELLLTPGTSIVTTTAPSVSWMSVWGLKNLPASVRSSAGVSSRFSRGATSWLTWLAMFVYLAVRLLVDGDGARLRALGARQTQRQHAVAEIRRDSRRVDLVGQRHRPIELTGRTLAPMNARVLVVSNRLLALDPQRIAANLNVGILLLDAGELRLDDEVVAVREHVQQRKRARTRRATAEPIAAHHAFHRALQTEQRRKRI